MVDTTLSIKFGAETGALNAAIDAAKAKLATFSTAADALKNSFSGVSDAQTGLDRATDTVATGFGKAQAAADALNARLDRLRTVSALAMGQFQTGMESNLTSLFDRIVSAGSLRNFSLLSGGFLGLTALAAGFATAETKVLAALQDTANQARVTAAEVTGLQVTFAKYGLTAAQTSTALTTLADRLLEAKAHGGELATAMQAAGIGFQNTDGSLRSTTSVLQDLIRYFHGSADEAAKTALATAAFGNELAGPFTAAVKAGGVSLDNLAAAMSRVGISMVNDITDAAVKIERILSSMFGYIDRLYSSVKPYLKIELTGADKLNIAVKDLDDAKEALAALQKTAKDGSPEITAAWDKVLKASQALAKESPIPVLAGGDPREKGATSTAPKASDATTAAASAGGAGSAKPADSDNSLEIIENLEDQLQLLQSVGAEHQRINDQIRIETALKQAGVTADSAEGQEIAKLVTQIDAATAASKRMKDAAAEIRQGFEQVGQSVSSSLMDMIQGQATLKDLARNVTLAIIQYAIESRVKMVADWAAGQAEKLLLTQASEAGQTGAVAAGTAARTSLISAASIEQAASQLAGVFKTIIASAAETFAGIFGFLAPVMGPLAAGPAAAGQASVLGVLGSIPGHATGSWEMSSDMLSVLHKGEMIVPAQSTPWAQSLMSAAAGGKAGPAPRASAPAVHFNVTAMDAGSVKRFFSANSRSIVTALNDAVSNGSHLGLRKLGR